MIEARQEAYFSLPDGYHQKEIIPLPKVYMDPIDKNLPIEEPAQAEGPPEWVSGPEGIAYTCEDVSVTRTVRTILPIPEGSPGSSPPGIRQDRKG
jgi:hypothetical protein